jgi:hypothetical protein
MNEKEQRLQRHLRAMGAVNRQLHAQLDGSPAWQPSTGPSDADLLTSPGATLSGALIGAGRRSGAANAWVEQLAASADGQAPFLIRLSSGKTFLVEGGYRRRVSSGVLAAALERVVGARVEVPNGEEDRWTDGVPVEVLEGPQGPPFVVVGGKRLSLRGLPLPYPVSAEQMQVFAAGRDLNIAEANVSRVQFQRAIYGGYQIDRARSAVARRGFVGATRAVASRISRRFQRASRAHA